MAISKKQRMVEEADWIQKYVRECRQQSEEARKDRLNQNSRNRDAYLNRQDWSHKQEGQSMEFLPKTTSAVELHTGFIKSGLMQFGEWFDAEIRSPAVEQMLPPKTLQKMMEFYLDNVWVGGNERTRPFGLLFSDAVKMGLLESLIILKVGGHRDPDGLWHLKICIIPPEDYYPDPTGEGLFEVHRYERDLSHVLELAEQGIYDKDLVQQLIGTSMEKEEDEKRRDEAKDQRETTLPGFRKRVVLEEFWGTILNEDGTILHRNVVCTVANDKFLIRPPEPNPFWHQTSPFVVGPIIRIPGSVWHKALMDQAVELNLIQNELVSLAIDGGIASVWGIKQIRVDDLEDPNQVQGGIPQGAVLAVSSTLPPGAKVLEQLSEGEIPQELPLITQMIEREFAQAALTDQISLGNLPTKEVRATEVVEAQQGQATTLQGILGDMEKCIIEPLLRKVWPTILQHLDDVPEDDLVQVIGLPAAVFFARMTPEDRYKMLARPVNFRVYGLTSLLSKQRDFQKMMAFLQVVGTNPAFFQVYMTEYSPSKTMQTLLKLLSINPDNLKISQEEMMMLQNRMQMMPMFAQAMGGGGGGAPQGAGSSGPAGLSAGNTGEFGLPAEIQQAGNPLTGMVGS